MKTDISEQEFRHALQIDHRFEWPDGDFEFWIVWDSVSYLVREHFGDERLDACERSGLVGDEATDAAWRRGLSMAEERSAIRHGQTHTGTRRMAYRVRLAVK